MDSVLGISIFLVLYPYLIYPLVIALVGKIRPRPVRHQAQLPFITVLIPAYNEVDCIGTTVQNKLDQDYPSNKFEIVVVSDGSSDGTDDVVKGFSERGVVLMRREGREGKAAALNAAVRVAKGEIIVFSDANSLFGPNALRQIAATFGDPDVGYLTGSLAFTDGDPTNLSGAGVGAYMRYENLVRSLETRIGSVIGVNGGVDAIRRHLYVDIPPHLITDFVLPLTVLANGYRVVYEPSVTSAEAPNTEIASEFRMRMRVALRAMQGLAYMRRLLNPLRYPLASFCLVSHKLLRYLGFVFMTGALVSNIVLAPSGGLYPVLLGLQLAAYGMALIGMIDGLPGGLKKLTVVPSYLLLSNAAFALAAFRFLRGDTMAVWRPRAG
ncbi:MAG: glycosyltransferase family 2 protein [Rhodocyclaceae bacterium]|nr:MAG: glycosyltransferase family 2 protein [Rhodocyclaceae bacterium]